MLREEFNRFAFCTNSLYLENRWTQQRPKQLSCVYLRQTPVYRLGI